MKIPSYTLEQLTKIATPYGVVVGQLDRFLFELIGKSVVIHIRIAIAKSGKMHRYWIGGGAEEFHHPSNSVLIRTNPACFVSTYNIKEAIEAATAEVGTTSIGALTKTDKSFLKFDLYTRQGGVCAYCLAPVKLRDATLDHMTPLSRGGADQTSNICVACNPCNNRKGNRTSHEFMESTILQAS